jgi:Tannase and feruloyl esterase
VAGLGRLGHLAIRYTLNYYDAVRMHMGPAAASNLMALYMIPGVYHCAGGPVAATLDLLTPLMAWVEGQVAPGRQVIAYRTTGDATSPITRTRPVFPYTAVAEYTGHGDVNQAWNYIEAAPTRGVSDVLDWAGLFHYKPSQQAWCTTKAMRNRSTLQCRPMNGRDLDD